MDDFAYFVKVMGVLCAVAMTGLLVWAAVEALGGRRANEPSQAATPIFSAPQTETHTFNLLPTQAANLQNRQFRKVEIRSEFPIQVMVGPCRESYTVDFFCDSEPSDIFISDQRQRPIFSAPQANPVTVTVTQY